MVIRKTKFFTIKLATTSIVTIIPIIFAEAGEMPEGASVQSGQVKLLVLIQITW